MPDSTDSPASSDTVDSAPAVISEPAETAAPAQESASADTLSADANPGSLPTDKPQTNSLPATGEALPQLKPEEIKQLLNLRSLYGRQAQELGEARKRAEAYQGLPSPEEIRATLEQRQREADVQKLQQWHPKHPDHQTAMSRLERVKHYSAAVQGATQGLPQESHDDVKARIAQSIGISNDDIQFHNQWVQNDQQVRQELARDPEGFIEQRVAALLERSLDTRFSQFEQYQTARVQAQQYLSENGKLMEANRERFLELMPQFGRDGALKLIQLEAENKGLRANIGKATEVQATAQAQQAALQKRSRVSRDQVSQPVATDALSIGTAKGLKGMALIQFIKTHNTRQAH